MNKLSNHIKQAFGLTAGVILVKAIEFLTLSYVIRTLGPELYGIFGSIKHYTSVTVFFMVGALHASVVKYVAKSISHNNREKSRAFSNTIFTASFLFVLTSVILSLFGIREVILVEYFNGYLDNSLYIATNALLILLALNSYLKSMLSSLQIIKAITVNTVAMGIINAAGMIITVLIYGLQGVVLNFVFVTALSCINLYLALPREFRPKLITKKKDFYIDGRFTTSYILPSFLSLGVVNVVTMYLNSTVLSWQDGAKIYGVYASCLTLATLSIVAQQSLGRVVFPLVMADGDSKTSESYRQYMNFNVSIFIGLVCGLPLILIPEVLGIIFGKEFSSIDAKQALMYVGMFTTIIAFREGIQRNLARKELQWLNLFSNCVWALTCSLYMFYSDAFSASSRAYAFFLAYSVQLIVFLPLYNKLGLLSKKASKKEILLILVLLILLIYGVQLLLNLTVSLRIGLFLTLNGWIAIKALRMRNNIRSIP